MSKRSLQAPAQAALHRPDDRTGGRMSDQQYDSMRDYWESHWLAIRIKRERGDDYFTKRPSTPKDERAA